MVLLRLSVVAAASLVALTLLAWLASAPSPWGDRVPCGDDWLNHEACYAALQQPARPVRLRPFS